MVSTSVWRGNLAALIGGTVPAPMCPLGMRAADTLHLAITLGLLLEPTWTGPRRMRDLPHNPPHSVDAVVETGIAAVARWPGCIEELVEQLRRRSRPAGAHYGVGKELGEPFAAWLRDLPDLPFANRIREEVYRQFDQDPVVQMEMQKSRIFEAPAVSPRARYITHKKSMSVLGCSFETLRRIGLDGLVAIPTRKGKGIPIALDLDHVVEQVAHRTGGITLVEAAARLSVPKARARELLRAGLLSEVPRDPRRRAIRAIDPAALNALVTAIESRTEPWVPAGKLISISSAAAILKSVGGSYADLVRAARDGSIRPAKIDCRWRGLRAIRFNRDEVLRLAQRARDAAEHIPVNAAARTLGLKWEVVDHLIDRALLPGVQAGPRRSRMIPRPSVDEFARRHRTGSALAKWMRTSPRRAAELLAERGIQPIVGPAQDGCRQNIYRLDDLSLAFPTEFRGTEGDLQCTWPKTMGPPLGTHGI